MAAFIPSRRDVEVTERALAKVTEDKVRESGDGFDGTWVAHPDLVPVARQVFDQALGDRPHQKDRLREDVAVTAEQLAAIHVPDGTITEAGVRLNINVALQYLDAWLAGNGAVAIYNLMEDTATAEISRAQLWQWIRHGAVLADGASMTAALYERLRGEELARLEAAGTGAGHLPAAAQILDQLVLAPEFVEFLTLIAYQALP
jgi:malate synthase